MNKIQVFIAMVRKPHLLGDAGNSDFAILKSWFKYYSKQ